MDSVRDNPARSRYELDVEGEVAFATYRKSGDVITILHTETPEALRGRGIGSRLIEGVMALMRAQGLKVKPVCGFARRVIAQHADFADLLA